MHKSYNCMQCCCFSPVPDLRCGFLNSKALTWTLAIRRTNSRQTRALRACCAAPSELLNVASSQHATKRPQQTRKCLAADNIHWSMGAPFCGAPLFGRSCKRCLNLPLGVVRRPPPIPPIRGERRSWKPIRGISELFIYTLYTLIGCSLLFYCVNNQDK